MQRFSSGLKSDKNTYLDCDKFPASKKQQRNSTGKY